VSQHSGSAGLVRVNVAFETVENLPSRFLNRVDRRSARRIAPGEVPTLKLALSGRGLAPVEDFSTTLLREPRRDAS
jgi:hypothetical protein